jgi:2-dehydro-3-deoxygluconokinase
LETEVDRTSQLGTDRARVVTFGEIMLRLSPPASGRLEQARLFDATFGGGEANVAVSLARFGLDAAFVTRLPANEIGSMAVAALRAADVDTSQIVRGGSRCGIYFLEQGSAQRPSKVVYDRAGSAMTEITTGMVPWAEVLAGASWFHTTGITPALSAGAAAAAIEAASAAKSAGVSVSIDLNYRGKLWNWGEAPEAVMTRLLAHADVAIGNEEDAECVFGMHADGVDVAAGRVSAGAYADVARQLVARFPNLRIVAFTVRGSISASENSWTGVLWQDGTLYETRSYRIAPIIDRVGAGDAFAAGIIRGLHCNPEDPQTVLDFAVAAGCLKHTYAGDFNLATTEEVERLAAGDGSGRVQR